MRTFYLVSTVLVVALAMAVYRYIILDTDPKSDVPLGSGAMFDTIAPYYDNLNTIMSLNLHMGWKRKLVQTMELAIDDDVLDIATGTGDVALLIAEIMSEKKGKMTPVHALDPSIHMLDIASKKAVDRGLDVSVRFGIGDAMDLSEDVKNASYSKISMSFGIRNVLDRVKALRELRRIIIPKADSLLCIMEFVAPHKGFLAPLASAFIKYLIPVLGGVFSSGHGEEYRHLSDSIMNFPDAEKFSSIIESSGFSKCEIENVFFHLVIIFVCKPIF